MMVPRPSVSIVVLAYNNLEATTHPCIESIFNAKTDVNYEVIIVDNASADGTATYITKLSTQHENVRVRINDSNLGYAGGNNVGISDARGDFIILLNNDTLVTDYWLEKLLVPFKDENVGLVGPVTNSAGNEQCLFWPEIDEQNFRSLTSEYCAAQAGRSHGTNRLGFFCVAMKASLVSSIGVLDEGFGLGMFEDDDFCIRVVNASLKLVIVEDCFVFHQGSSSFKKLSKDVFSDLFQKNREYLFQKHGVIWTYSDILAAIWRRIEIEISADPDEITPANLLASHHRKKLMVDAITHLKSIETGSQLSKSSSMASQEIEGLKSQLMEISEWATTLKHQNDELAGELTRLKSSLPYRIVRRLIGG